MVCGQTIFPIKNDMKVLFSRPAVHEDSLCDHTGYTEQNQFLANFIKTKFKPKFKPNFKFKFKSETRAGGGRFEARRGEARALARARRGVHSYHITAVSPRIVRLSVCLPVFLSVFGLTRIYNTICKLQKLGKTGVH